MVALGPIWMIPWDLLMIQQWYQSRGSIRVQRSKCKCMHMKDKQIDGLTFDV